MRHKLHYWACSELVLFSIDHFTANFRATSDWKIQNTPPTQRNSSHLPLYEPLLKFSLCYCVADPVFPRETVTSGYECWPL